MNDTTRIAAVRGRQIFDSRGRPTVEVDVTLHGGAFGQASAPSGASTGRYEAHELRDGDSSAYAGRGVRNAVRNVDGEIARCLIGMDAVDQAGVDAAMRDLDGTDNLGRLGANAVLATSLAVCRAAAAAQAIPLYRHIAALARNDHLCLPMPMVNILSGGAHAGRSMDVQDFLVVPIGARTYDEALKMALQVRQAASDLSAARHLPTLLADEGGLSPALRTADEALQMLTDAIVAAGFVPGREIAIAIDVAASELFTDGVYDLRNEHRRLTGAQMIAMVKGWLERYAVISIEDALHQDDWDNWTRLCAAAPHAQLIGDDLFATNVSRIARGIRMHAANAVLIKPNQNGTVSGTLDALAEARRAGFATIVSARSGETEDSFIADLAVGTGAGQIKIGSVRTTERMCKYNRLLRIGEDQALPFAGNMPFRVRQR